MLWNNSISDLHCHLLHAIDDGPREIDETMKLLELEKKQNVNKVMLTPHFNCDMMSIEVFIDLRNASYKQLCDDPRYKKLKISTRLGSEVFYSNKLINMDLELMCFENSKYILIEFPVEILPFGITKAQIVNTMRNIISKGCVPIIAHIERYSFLKNEPTLIPELISMGCIGQVNAWGIIKEAHRERTIRFIKEGYAHIVCSDAHSLNRRRPNIHEAYVVIHNELGEKYCKYLIKNSVKIFNGMKIVSRV